jgi:hypothetical protein
VAVRVGTSVSCGCCQFVLRRHGRSVTLSFVVEVVVVVVVRMSSRVVVFRRWPVADWAVRNSNMTVQSCVSFLRFNCPSVTLTLLFISLSEALTGSVIRYSLMAVAHAVIGSSSCSLLFCVGSVNRN